MITEPTIVRGANRMCSKVCSKGAESSDALLSSFLPCFARFFDPLSIQEVTGPEDERTLSWAPPLLLIATHNTPETLGFQHLIDYHLNLAKHAIPPNLTVLGVYMGVAPHQFRSDTPNGPFGLANQESQESG